ncbi:unnamed protein product [Peniophora sp. CBMAI 1063]|nr:unnamed protein product [Peniophora sp. CBMAI 1063]
MDTPIVPVTPPSFFPVSNPTHAFWTHGSPDANPLAREGSTGDLHKNVDVAIIGSGITGVSIAYHLANLVKAKNGQSKEPLKVAIFEARDFCSGATGRNGGHLTSKGPYEFAYDLERFGIADAIRQVQIEDYTVSEVQKVIREHGLEAKVDFQEYGRVTVLGSEEEYEELRASVEAAKKAKVDVREHVFLDKEEMLKRYGIEERGFVQPGSNLWPLKLVTELYTIAQNITPNLSLTLHTHTPVHSVVATGSAGRWNLSTPRGSVTATRVVHATNAYLPYLIPHMSSQIVPTRSQLIAFRANADRPIPHPAIAVNNESDYWFPRPAEPGEGQVIIAGGCRRYAGPPYASGTVDDGEVDGKVGTALRRLLPEVFPDAFDTEEVEAEMEWTGIMGYPSTGCPFVGPLLDESGTLVKGQYICGAYRGHGMPRAYACAEAVARMVAGDIGATGKWELPEWLPRCYLTVLPPGAPQEKIRE